MSFEELTLVIKEPNAPLCNACPIREVCGHHPSTPCTDEAIRRGLINPSAYYFYDALVHVTWRLKHGG